MEHRDVIRGPKSESATRCANIESGNKMCGSDATVSSEGKHYCSNHALERTIPGVVRRKYKSEK